MGCGRVGASLAGILDAQGHSVAVIDSDSKAFQRLPRDFSGRRVTGLGMDRDTLKQAGIKDAYAFAAVSSGDNTNIIAARVPERAFVYERLGIPTVATVKRTTESVLRRLMPPDAAVTWTHPSGLVSLVTATPIADWYGIPFPTVETLTGERIAFVSRLGTILPARPELVIQEYDQLYFAISGEDPLPLRDILTRAPRMED